MRKITLVAVVCGMAATMMIVAAWQLAPTEPKAAIQTTGAAEASLAPISVFEMMGRHGKSLPAQAWDAF
jgi:hypothetical protein